MKNYGIAKIRANQNRRKEREILRKKANRQSEKEKNKKKQKKSVMGIRIWRLIGGARTYMHFSLQLRAICMWIKIKFLVLNRLQIIIIIFLLCAVLGSMLMS